MYKRNELGLRMALLHCSGSASDAFGALNASEILGGPDVKLGFMAWRWPFFVEGALTIVVAESAIWIIPDFLSTPSVWLLPDEQILATRRIEEEVVARIEHEGKPKRNLRALLRLLGVWGFCKA
ncbi:hypothetical protein EDD22DRAFT_212993 [Suillus occidentalis]|nr:hypothetical protein EDD22DRAFT_212993 [Suillus occidentalis]